MAVSPKDLTAATIARDRLVRNQTVNSRHAGRSQHLGTNNEAALLLATADDRALLTLNRKHFIRRLTQATSDVDVTTLDRICADVLMFTGSPAARATNRRPSRITSLALLYRRAPKIMPAASPADRARTQADRRRR